MDFHYDNSSSDYTSRILESSSGTIKILNNLLVNSALSAPTLNSNNVTVANNLRASHYDLQTVAQLGGAFYVSPTLTFPSQTTSQLVVTKNNDVLTLAITDSSITSAELSGIAWTQNSAVKVSGTINGVATGTMDGTIDSVNLSSHVLTVSVSGSNSSAVSAGTYTTSQFSDLSIMVYQRRLDGSTMLMNSASGAIASFTDGADGVSVKSLTVAVEPVQSGSGDPSPSNIRPISGWNQIQIWVQDEVDRTADPTVTVQLGRTVYGGTLDVTTGVLTVDKLYRELSSSIPWTKSSSYSGGFYTAAYNLAVDGHNPKTFTPFICSHAKSATEIAQYANGTCYMDNSVNIRIMNADTTVEQWGAYLDAQATANTPVSCCFELDSPFTYQLTPTQVTTLLGNNNIYSNTGNTSVTYSTSTPDTNDYNVGILMNCYDTANSSSTIRVYGGTSTIPNVMIGNLTNAGLGVVNGLEPTGWGLFAQNAFLHGSVVAERGKIGGFTLSEKSLYTVNNYPSLTNFYLMPTGVQENNYSIGGSSTRRNDWVMTAGNAFGVTRDGTVYANQAVISGVLTAGANSSIGPWNVTSTSIYKEANTLGSSSPGAAYFGDLGLSVGNKFTVEATGVATLGLSSEYHATMSTQSFDVKNGQTLLASFGQDAIIGNVNTGGIFINSDGFIFYNSNKPNFYIGTEIRDGGEMGSAQATVTHNSITTTIDDSTYYRVASISASYTVICVYQQWISGTAIIDGVEEEMMFAPSIDPYQDWIVQNGYLWVKDHYDDMNTFQEKIYYDYVYEYSQTQSPYIVLGEYPYTEDIQPGSYSLSQGYKCIASGSLSTAIGSGCTSSGLSSFACGFQNVSSNDYSFAEGCQTISSGEGSHSEGYKTTSSGSYSHSEGKSTTASNTASHSEGYYSKATGYASHSEGEVTTASGRSSHSEGGSTHATGYASHSEGAATTASGDYSHAQNHRTMATAECQTVIGRYNDFTMSLDTDMVTTIYDAGNYAFVIGNGTSYSTRSNALTVDWDGNVTATGNVMAANTSHVGMIIMSTTLDTEAKVKAIYGGTTWIQHSGYFLRGASSGVTANSADQERDSQGNALGVESVTLTADQSGVGSHSHSVNTKRTNITVNNNGNTTLLCHSSNGGTAVTEANASGYIGTKSAAASSSHNNMPPYKNVYIWERTA